MQKNNNRGFVLAETLVVTIFLMTIFTMLYVNFYPLIGEYEKRETYDDVDGKYAAYWLKRLIEDNSYSIPDSKVNSFRTKGYVRFECNDVVGNDKRQTCINLVQSLEIENCNHEGNLCEIYITKYRLGGPDGDVWFKSTVENNTDKAYQEVGDIQSYINKCKGTLNNETILAKCTKQAHKKLFRSGFKDYIETLPDYRAESLNYAKYRVITSIHHRKDNNNYYSYSTIEVNR